ncbi:Metallo-dependent phosphatase-like protein [Amylostereum chailletii]|nr:Metallo-dependent phosphatase-like protein [Amylostereum chailletii]
MIQIPIIHWNDVYRVRPQKISPTSSETIDVTQFAALIDDIRCKWPSRQDGKKDGLSLFSGDVFSPSVESSVTRGSHMVPVMNCLSPDVSLLGNHDFDFGYPHLCKLIDDTQFPWLLSNVIDAETGRVPDRVSELLVIERRGVRIGVIGLIEKEWIGTISSWPSNFEYRDMAHRGKELSERLRDPAGEYRCDLVIALTHARCDVKLAKALLALTPTGQLKQNIANTQGVDIILGGHDHLYFVGRGADAWENYDLSEKVLGAEEDDGDVLVVKSGTDFRDLSEIILEVEDAPEGSIRRKIISRVQGVHHEIKPDMRSSNSLQKILDKVLKSLGSTLKAPLCQLEVELDLRSQFLRTRETAGANWFADILRHTYDDALCMNGIDGGADGVFICAGMLRGDSVYGPGYLTLGDVLEILPFEDPLVVIEVDGQTLWDTLEASLETWPAQEGRFPVIAGFRVSWDSRRPTGQRVLGVWLQEESLEHGDANDSDLSTPVASDGEPIKRERGGRRYTIVTREYMAQGHDGFAPLKGQKYIVDDESGQITSSIVRKYLLGAQFVNKLASVNESREHLHPDTHAVIAHEREALQRRKPHYSRALEHWQRATSAIIQHRRSKRHYRDHIGVSAKEHMSTVDCFDGAKARTLEGSEDEEKSNEGSKEHLLVAHPVVDGRLKDEGRS